jgi:hypothetical protein
VLLNRREALRAALALPVVASLAPAVAAPANDEFADPQTLLDAYLRLSGAMDNRLIIWWMDGVRYGVVDARATALFGMKVGMFHQFFRQSDGSYRLAMFELTYYTDLETGELLDAFSNPYTGETNKVRHVRLGPEIRRQTVAGIARPENPMVQAYASSLGPALVHDDEVWIPTSVEATIRFPKPAAPEIVLSIYTTIHGNATDALDKDIVSARCTLAFQNTLRWEPFMRMGDRPGHMMSRAAGRKLEAVDALPADYRSIAERMHPRYIENPTARLAKLTQKISGRG